jgi:hypothetical protein
MRLQLLWWLTDKRWLVNDCWFCRLVDWLYPRSTDE